MELLLLNSQLIQMKTKKRLLSIIVPVYNEEKTIAYLLNTLITLQIKGWDKEIIVVNDGSTDNSLFEILLFQNYITLIRSKINLGMGNALKKGIQASHGEIILFQYSDSEYNPQNIPSLLLQFSNKKITAVYGTRYKEGQRRGYFLYFMSSQIFTLLINILYRTNLTDAFTGYKVFRNNALKVITSNYDDFAFNVDITTKLLKKGGLIVEQPVEYYPRTFSEGKKISPWIGIKDLFIILRNCFL